MQFNKARKDKANSDFKKLNNKYKDQMRLSSVRLKNNSFTCSGVLVEDSENRIGIITAKHNLCINAKKDTPLVWIEEEAIDLIFKFLKDLTVGYNAPGIDEEPDESESLSPDSSDIEFRKGWGTWDYDLMFISLKEGLKIREWAKQNYTHRIKYMQQDGTIFVNNFIGKDVFVTGYGNMLQADSQKNTFNNYFQVRTAKLCSTPNSVLRHKMSDVYFHAVFSVTACDHSSTAPGDSGGPIFIVHNNRVLLLGLTLGSNFHPDKIIPDDTIKSNEATCLYYKEKYFMRMPFGSYKAGDE